MAALPVEALRLDPPTASGLRRVGLQRIGELAPMPRDVVDAQLLAMVKPPLVAIGQFILKKSADVIGVEGIEQLLAIARGTDAGEADAAAIGGQPDRPKRHAHLRAQIPGHSLAFPFAALAVALDAIENALNEWAFDQLRGRFGRLGIELSLGDISDGRRILSHAGPLS